MNNFLDIVKYLVYGMIVYVLFSYVPQNKLPLTDVLVITIVIMMTYMLLDFIAPYNNIENLDPDYIDEPKVLNAKQNDPEFSNLGSIDGIGNLDDMNDSDIEKNNVFSVDDFNNNSSEIIAKILVDSGLSSSAIDELLLLFKKDKNSCNNKLKKMKDDGKLSEENLHILTANLLDSSEVVSQMLISGGLSSVEIDDILLLCETDKKACDTKLKEMNTSGILNNKQLNVLSSYLVNKKSHFADNILKELCKTNKKDCKEKINSLTYLSNEKRENLINSLNKLSESDIILNDMPLTDSFRNELSDLCLINMEECRKKIKLSSTLSDDQKQKLIEIYNRTKIDNDNKIKDAETTKVASILKKILPDSDISNDELININNICKNKDQCRNKLSELVVSGSISNEDKLKLSIMHGLDEYSELGELFNTNRLNENHITELGNVCNKSTPSGMCNSVLNKYIENGILNQEEANSLITNIKSYQSGNLQENEIINELLQTGNLNTAEANKIHKVCSLKNSQNCTKVLKELKDSSKISDSEMKVMLRIYKKNTIPLNNTSFGSISNESELGSVNNSEKLSSLKNAFGSSDMKFSQLDPEMHKPLGEFSSDFNNNFEYGYAYLNTSKWKVPMYKPPVCKSEEHCKVCPTNTQGYPVDVKEWNRSRKIMPPDNINIEYLSKLNQGN